MFFSRDIHYVFLNHIELHIKIALSNYACLMHSTTKYGNLLAYVRGWYTIC